jgi:hypothetical protein
MHDLTLLLLTLSRELAPVGLAALGALAATRWIPATAQRELLNRIIQFNTPQVVWKTLMQLAPHMSTDHQQELEVALEQNISDQTVRGECLRWLLLQESSEKPPIPLLELLEGPTPEFDPTPVLLTFADICPEPEEQLMSLIYAGSDDSEWTIYHEYVAKTISILLQQHDSLFSALLVELRLAITESNWLRYRIVLAALARSAEVMPAQYNRFAVDLESLLLQFTIDVTSYDVRRFAITALSHLRVISPMVLTRLLTLAGDNGTVQQDVITAAGRFNRLHPSMGQSIPSELVAAIYGRSSARACAAVKLLEAVGTSHAADVRPGFRQQIVEVLTEALNNVASRRTIWLYESEKIADAGIFRDHLYAALLRVSGFTALSEITVPPLPPIRTLRVHTATSDADTSMGGHMPTA